jgi:kynureninase
MAYRSKLLYDSNDLAFLSLEFAAAEDQKDPLRHLRDEFIIPTKVDLQSEGYGRTAPTPGNSDNAESTETCVYLCGNSLGLQPRRTSDYVKKYLDTWASKGVYGHFKELKEGLPPWLHIDDAIKEQTAKMVGALPGEVVVMETLTANLHLLMASFYKPTKDRYKIIIEGKAFPSDHVSGQTSY